MNKFPCVLMRGGTSKAAFFHESDMPLDREKWEAFLVDVMGSPDKRQIDGIGGANSLTSKVAIIKKSDRLDADVDYTFAQVSLMEHTADFKGNCGNISSAVGPFAVEEKLVEIEEPITTIRIYNTNTDKIIVSKVIVKNNEYQWDGDCEIPGVPGTGSQQWVTFTEPQGAVTKKLLPTGNPIDEIDTSKGKVNISIVDAANPLVFMYAEEVGLTGTELPEDYSKEQLDYVEEIRSIAVEMCGFTSREEATKKSPAVPKTTIVCNPKDYADSAGRAWSKKDMDIVIRMMSMQKPHQALAITGAICTSVALHTEGTIVNKIVGNKKDELLLGHPSGIMKTKIESKDNVVKSVSAIRTARRLFEGYVFTKKYY